MIDARNLIAGSLQPPSADRWLDNIEPATGQRIGRVPDSDEHDVARAVDAASAAFGAWSKAAPAERSALLLRLAQAIDDNAEELAALESMDQGKPVALARRVDIPRAAANFRFFATAILHEHEQAFRTHRPAVGTGSALSYTLGRARGVAACISPWNLPLYLLTWKIAPALAAGCTVVAKPSELTPLTATRLAELSVKVGLAPGVLNIVHGTGPRAGEALVAHPATTSISFTGGTATGRRIASVAGGLLKRTSLELGGKNPFMLFADAARGGSLDHAIDVAVRAAFTNQGEICLCGSRLLVERGVFDAVLKGVVARTRELHVGDPREPTTDQGALVSDAHRSKVEQAVHAARSLGGTVHCGGARPTGLGNRCAGGFFYEPTVISGLDPACSVEQQEIFGPVLTVTPFDDEQHALSLANGTTYGLAATLWTGDVGRAHRLAAALDFGIVWINTWMLRDLRTPFGGTKHSGIGREGGSRALEFFREECSVTLATD